MVFKKIFFFSIYLQKDHKTTPASFSKDTRSFCSSLLLPFHLFFRFLEIQQSSALWFLQMSRKRIFSSHGLRLFLQEALKRSRYFENASTC